MVQALIAIGSLYISWVDLREHRIYNRDLIAYALVLSLKANPIPFKWILSILILALLATILFRIGGGDFKLFAVLLLTHGVEIASTEYFSCFFFALSASLLIASIRHRTLHCAVPLAPAIALPFLLIYLGI